jgi:hypothetical protein
MRAEERRQNVRKSLLLVLSGVALGIGAALLFVHTSTRTVESGSTILPTAAQLGFYEVTIVEVTNVERVSGRDIVNATLVFSKPIANGNATMVVTVFGRKKTLGLWTFEELDPGAATTRLNVQWAPRSLGLTPTDLQSARVRIYSCQFPPELWLTH